VQPVYPVATNYYAPQPVAMAEPALVPPQSADPMPVVRRRVTRRRSSPVPALLGAVVAVVAALGGFWLYSKNNETVAVVSPNDGPVGSVENAQRQDDPPAVSTQQKESTPTPTGAAPDDVGRDPANPISKGSETDSPGPMDDDQPRMAPPPAEGDKPTTDKSGSEVAKPESDRPIPEPKPKEASPEEAAAIAKSLQEVRAALAKRELSKAKDLLDEATIEASAPDSRARVNRVEILISYVENFWDAVRKTLPKLEAAETIEIDGTTIAIVEADEEHLVVRIEGRNREYPWQKLPAKIAYYLANRWLAPDDPVRNLVLAAFEIVEPKGDLTQAQSLLDAATAARLNAEPLYAELKTARGG
jgi:hypothetical protein